MDKLETYLDQVCRGIGGPRAMRQHIRQELREHLLDAAAEHKKAGVPEEQALAQALADFGAPDDVRSELEATHGHRMLGVILDKALDWKEKTMRAKWLWSTWAHLAVAAAILLEVMLLTFIVMSIIPKFQRLMHDGMIEVSELNEQGVGWMPGLLQMLRDVGGHATAMLLLTVAAIGLFEWRVRSENKSLIRLSALGTVAAVLMFVVMLTASSLVIPTVLAMPAMVRMARPWAVEQVAAVESSIGSLEQALEKKDWEQADEQAKKASNAMTRLSVGPAVSSLTAGRDSQAADSLRGRLAAAQEKFADAQKAIADKNAGQAEAALKQFYEAYAPLKSAAWPGK